MSADGLLFVLKPPGMSSHDVVSFARRRLSERRIGHLGTLDPGAAGVLVLACGKATALARYGLEAAKRYRADAELGVATDTQDAFGLPGPVHRGTVSLGDLRAALQALVGEKMQTAPPASAKKVGGRPLYARARAGERVVPPTQQVRIDAVRLLAVAQPGGGYVRPEAHAGALATPGARALFDVECSKGTYVRTLCDELGRALGCGAHMRFLLRTAAPPATLAECIALEALDGDPLAQLKPLDRLVGHLPALRPPVALVRRLAQGQRVVVPGRPATGLVRIYAPDGRLAAIARAEPGPSGTRLQPDRVLLAPDEVEAG